MRRIISMLTVCLISSIACAQVQQTWVARANGAENKDEYGGILGRDAAGFIYVAGSRQNTADDENSGFLTIKYNPLTGAVVWARLNDGAGNGNAGPADMLVDQAGNVYVTGTGGPTSHGEEWYTIKYNTNGVQLWEDAYTNSRAGESAAAIAVDAQGNVFVTGQSYTDGGIRSITVIKYDAAGNRKWIRYYNGNDDQGGATGIDIAVDALGNVYVTGYASYTGTKKDLILLKYDNNGVQLSSNRYDGPYTDEPVSMVLDAAGNVYIAGKSTVIDHEFDVLTLKYNSNCNIIWERLFNGSISKSDIPQEIQIDAWGSVFVAGSTTVNLSGTDGDYLLIKYDSDGNKLWEGTYGGANNVNDAVSGLEIDPAGNIYLTGYSGNIGSNTAIVDYITLKYNSSGVQQWLIRYNGPDGYSDMASDILADPDGNIYVTGTSFGTSAQDDIATVKYTQCEIICPSNISVNNTPGTCGAVVTYAAATTSGYCGSSITYSHPSGSTFPVGTTTATATSDETGASCSFTVTVVDNQKPVFSLCPSNKTVPMGAGVCYATAASVNAGTATATDNCGATVAGVRSDGQPLTANYPGGVTTITWTATDRSGNTETCTQTITVVDNQPPVVSNASVSKSVLSPPNHKMVDVMVGFTVTDNCSATASIAVSSDEPQVGLSDGDQGPDWIIINNNHIQLRAERDGKGDGRVYTITITATDGSGNITTETKTVVVAHNISSPRSGTSVKVGSTVNFAGTFWDVAGNKHTAKWLIDDKIAVTGTVAEPSGMNNGTVTGSYKFTAPGVYKLKMNITDQKGVTTSTTTNGNYEAIIVVYDPNGGYTFGGGYFTSPAGALRSNPSTTGDVSYGYTVNYYKGATNPKGETQFEFKVGDFEYNALSFDYLSISGAKAQFKGTGRIIGGQSGVSFIMTVVDGQLDGSGVDKVRMKIYNKSTGQVHYDNQPGASDAANPVTAVGANSTVVISSNAVITTINKAVKDLVEVVDDGLQLKAFPNPTTSNFMLSVNSNNRTDRIIMQVINVHGQIIETRTVTNNQTISLGEQYRPGAYYVRIIQGDRQKQAKLIKIK